MTLKNVTQAQDTETPAEKQPKEKTGSRNKHLLLITSLVFGGSLIGCIVVGFSLPKPGQRTPHMSAGKPYPDDDPEPEVRNHLQKLNRKIFLGNTSLYKNKRFLGKEIYSKEICLISIIIIIES